MHKRPAAKNIAISRYLSGLDLSKEQYGLVAARPPETPRAAGGVAAQLSTTAGSAAPKTCDQAWGGCQSRRADIPHTKSVRAQEDDVA